MKRLLCLFLGHNDFVAIADGVGGINRYYLSRCERCGRLTWERIRIGNV